MKPKLLVSGCSITHGAELHNGFMHEENIKRSYSAYLSRALDTELVNIALSGASNEYIFHSIIDNLHTLDNIHSVVIMWTSPNRLYWKNQGRHWFMLPNWASSMQDPFNFKMHDRLVHGAWITGDNNQVVDELCNIYPFMVQNCFDHNEMTKKTVNYQQAIKAICDVKQIKLVQLNINDLLSNQLMTHMKHPSDSEHESIAKFILENYYENN
jgi:hypothetical protein